ncbi:MAG: T9SS type A sorting domain-containing protein, partial [Fibrobacteres bacterium]|nr:T9SS type A sorting domain-containing protein [Fibrobacterota bacterium]
PRYVARPSMVANHAYEITGDYKYFYPAKLGTYVLRNVIRRNPIGYLAIAGDELYCSPANTPWATDHPGITIPKYYSGSDFQIGIGMEALYSFLMKTDDEEIRDALIFAGRSMMWRMNQDSLGRWSGFTYSGWSDYGYSGKPYKFKWSLNSDQNGGRGYYSSASEGFGGFIFSYLASGRTDFLPVLKDGWDAWGQKLSDLKAINLYIAMHKRDSLDAVPPSAVQNLTASPSSSGGLQLRWTAPGGNGSSGRAAYYQVKVSKVPMVDIAEKWNQETQTGWPDLRDSLPYTIQALELKAVNYTQKVAKSFWALPNILGEPVPQEAGTSETMNIPDLDTSTTWYAAVVSYDSAGNVSSISNIAASRASAGEKVRDNCTTLSLSANPNPFNPVTKITVSLPATLNPVDRVKLSIFSTDGKLIKTLEDCVVKESSLTTVWNANSANNKNVSSGIYILKLQYGKTVLQKRITLLR